jgi:hypothetical protein
VFAGIGGSLGSSATQRAGFWTDLDLDLGPDLARDETQVVAAGYPQSSEVSCADPSIELSPLVPADSRVQVKHGTLDIRWRTERSWAGTCRTLVLRFVAPGWTGVDAVFVARFSPEEAAKRRTRS